MLTKRSVFMEIGGFDENISHSFNDVDLCLKMRTHGYWIVYTPFAELYHHESLSRGLEDTPEKRERFTKEVKAIRMRWGHVIDSGDPFYNPKLTVEGDSFSFRQ
jgi:GT2 family glycosyltransferase